MGHLRSFVLCMLMCVCKFTIAQNISGMVVDAQNTAIPYCTVTCSQDSVAHSIISYAITKDDGSFTIQSHKSLSSFWLTARCVGYATLRIHYKEMPTAPLRLVIEEDSYTLSEITVKGRNLGAKIKNDTIEFSPDVFKNGSEQNMSDVIKKLPGMTVDESGNVSYQGKKIDKFLVNGEDVLSTGGHALKTLSADFASGVELLNNYNDGNVGNSFNSKETTALNLINKDLHNKWAGNFTEGGGVKNKFDSKNSALKMDKKVSASIIANANNTNETVFSIMDYLNANGGLTGVKTTNGFAQLSLSSAERNVLMPSNDEYKRTSGIGNVNLTLKPTSHYNATIGVIHNEMDAKSALSTEQHVKVAQEVIRKSTEENGKKRGNFSSFNLSQKWDVNPYASLRFQTKLAYSDMRNNMSIMDYYNNNSDRNADNDKNKGFNVLQQVNLNSLIGKGLLYGSVDFAFSKSEKEGIDYERLIENGEVIACGEEVIDYAEVEKLILGLQKNYKVKVIQIGYDRYNAISSVNKFEAAEYECVEIKQHSSVLHRPTKWLQELILSQKFKYMDAIYNLLENNFSNARCTEDTNLNKYVNKKRSSGKVDMVVALINALYMLQLEIENRETDFEIQII